MEIGEALAKAHETLNSTPAPEPAETSTTPAPESAPEAASGPVAPSPAASARARDEQGRFAPKSGDEPAEKVAAAPKAGANGAAAAAPPAAEAKPGAGTPPSPAPGEAVSAKPAEPAARPPQSWRADEREEFAKAPPKVQAAILRREKEITAKLNEVAQTTRTAQEFQQVAAPYEALFRSQGVSATQAFQNLANTYYLLQSGPPQQKAQILAQVIQQAGVPVEMLAQALDGQPGQAAAPVDPQAIAHQVEQRIRAQLSQQAAQATAQRNQQRLQSFAESHEFFDDVRERMADILAARGQGSPSDKELDEVYDLACRVHPEIAGVIRQREASKAVQSAQASTAATQAAASSVRSTPAAAPSRTAQPRTTKDAIAAAREQLGMK